MSILESPTTARYFELVARFPLRPIRSEEMLDRATEVMRALTGDVELAEDEEDYLEVLGGLIEAYEDEHDPMPGLAPAERLKLFLGRRGASPADLARGTQVADSTISAILAGRRGIGKGLARKFAVFFEVSAERFLD